ncbi:N-acetyltransferase [Streptomyces sp. NPDC059517]|uniref:N-acetyltransferase n=1 Tax=Streptomyces sp. NPDC059517 TaxID=3346855 RepID=UPI0036CFD906
MTVELDPADPISSYSVRRADRTPLGTADFVVVPGALPGVIPDALPGVREERIFFHTEVCQDFGGRELVELLVSTALTDSMRDNATVVPLCPMFARHLRVHGDTFIARGGVFRRPVADDIGVITRATLGEV